PGIDPRSGAAFSKRGRRTDPACTSSGATRRLRETPRAIAERRPAATGGSRPRTGDQSQAAADGRTAEQPRYAAQRRGAHEDQETRKRAGNYGSLRDP